MPANDPSSGHRSVFESIKHTDEDGDYWSARELSRVLGYTQWRNFVFAIDKARTICEASGQCAEDHFLASSATAMLGSDAEREIDDYRLTRYAMHLTLLCGDLKKPKVIQALVYLSLVSLNAEADYRPMARALGISFPSSMPITKEQRTLGQIMAAFKHIRGVQKYRVAPYYLDLYFPDYRIAVECDEYGHRQYSKEAEDKRQSHIEQAIECRFVRYNPDDPDFNVGDVINRLMLLVYGQEA